MSPQFGTLGVVGLGLIGGSVALGVRKRSLAQRVVGVEANPDHRAEAIKLQLADEVLEEVSGLAECELVVIATPPRTVPDMVREVLTVAPQAIVTDTAGVKLRIGLALGEGSHLFRSRYVPGHPMAGNERSGPTAADADLFEGRRVLLCPSNLVEAQAAEKVEALWKALGATPYRCDVGDHDIWMGAVSHAPHLIAFALARSSLQRVGGNAQRVAEIGGPTLQDMTRVAASDPEVWVELLLMNREAVVSAALQFSIHLDDMIQALRHGDETKLRQLLVEARAARQAVLDAS